MRLARFNAVTEPASRARTQESSELHIVTRANDTETARAALAPIKHVLPRHITRLSAYGLEAGDPVVVEALPDGGPILRPGDALETEIGALGVMRNEVLAEA